MNDSFEQQQQKRVQKVTASLLSRKCRLWVSKHQAERLYLRTQFYRAEKSLQSILLNLNTRYSRPENSSMPCSMSNTLCLSPHSVILATDTSPRVTGKDVTRL